MQSTEYMQSTLYRLETYANEAFGGQTVFYFSEASVKNLGVFLGNKKTDDEKNKLTSGIVMRRRGIDGTLDASEKVNYDGLRKLYYKVEYFHTEWPSFEGFLAKLKALATEMVAIHSKKTLTRAQAASTATAMMGVSEADNEEVKKRAFIPVPLNTNLSALCYQRTKPDDEWTFLHLVKDGDNQLYWRFRTPVKTKEGIEGDIVYPLIVKDGRYSKYIAPDDIFWGHFFEEEGDAIYEYFQRVLAYMVTFRQGLADIADYDSIKGQFPAFEAGLRSICPTALIKCLHVGFDCVTVKGKTFIQDVAIKLRSPESAKPIDSFERENLRPILSVALLQGVPMEKLQTIKVFDDVGGTSIHTLPKQPCDIPIPECHPLLSSFGCPTWDMFLRGKGPEGNTKFPSQRMGELRLAKAVVSIVNKRDYSRQILSCFGAGNDGKTVCFDAIANIVGKKCSLTGLSFKFVKGDQFGLAEAINRRMIVFDDVEDAFEFFTDEMVKKISGAESGELMVNRKHDSKYAWSPSGCKVIMSTNNQCALYDESTISRCLPLTFLQNYSYSQQADSVELKKALSVEGPQFLRWCYSVCLYYNNIRNAKGELSPLFLGAHTNALRATQDDDAFSFIGKNLLVCTDEQFDRWCSGELDLLPDSVSMRRMLREEAYTQETSIPHRADPMVIIKQRDSEEDEVVEYLYMLCDLLFVRDDEAVLRCADLGLYLLEYISMPSSLAEIDPTLKKISQLIRACGMSEYKSFDKIKYSKVYRGFKQVFTDKFGVRAYSMRDDSNTIIKAYKGVRMKKLGETMDGNPPAPTESKDIF